MPRLSTSLLRCARAEHPYLPLLLRQCRDLPSARNELRWLRQYLDGLAEGEIEGTIDKSRSSGTSIQRSVSLRTTAAARRRRLPSLLELCAERSRGRPLQYILGTQPFGALELLCRKKVLIPRNDTESYVLRAADLLIESARRGKSKKKNEEEEQTLAILDLGTGSGCIALSLHAALAPHFPRLRIVGTDRSAHALALARRNLRWNVRRGNLHPRAAKEVRFVRHDFVRSSFLPQDLCGHAFRLVVSNPPYVTPAEFISPQTSRSVRRYEPKEALVPEANGSSGSGSPSGASVGASDYMAAIQAVAENVRAEALICELGNEAQFAEMASMLQSSPLWHRVEVWCDYLGPGADLEKPLRLLRVPEDGGEIDVFGEGSCRVVVGTTAGCVWLPSRA